MDYGQIVNEYGAVDPGRGRYAPARAVALYFAWYNFKRVHQTLRVTPAMEAGIADRIWTVSDLLDSANRDIVEAAA